MIINQYFMITVQIDDPVGGTEAIPSVMMKTHPKADHESTE